MKSYLLCYDIRHPKRLKKVAKIAYAHALGGQKSVLEMPLEPFELEVLKHRLKEVIKEEDSLFFVPFLGEPILLGRADFLNIEDGAIII